MLPTPAKASFFYATEDRPTPHHPAKGIEPQLARIPPVPSMPASLSVPPPRRLDQKSQYGMDFEKRQEQNKKPIAGPLAQQVRAGQTRSQGARPGSRADR